MARGVERRWMKIYEVGGLSASHEHASRLHERPIVSWLWSAGSKVQGPKLDDGSGGFHFGKVGGGDGGVVAAATVPSLDHRGAPGLPQGV
uniref:Uncharacterized protein n=1 Tax=Aegilops tauschii TaxID=37682 RepID=R7W6S2_AEGTA